MKYLLTLLLAVCCAPAFSQAYNGNDDYVPPSPNAFGAISRVNTSVNLYTGVANISIPITTLPGRKAQIPVSLSYAAGGIKVQDVPTWAGTGWSVEAGGMITRIVRGLPDEQANGFCGTNNIGEKAYEDFNLDYISKVASKQWDSEPDLFFFNFLGKAGKFVLDETGSPVQLPATSFQITPGICNATGSTWTITDDQGIVYTFAQPETTYYTLPNETTEKSHISSWYLTEMRMPGNEDVVTFSYATSNEIIYSYYTQEAKSLMYNKGNLIPSDKECVRSNVQETKDKEMKIRYYPSLYLSRISTDKGTLEFGKEWQWGGVPRGLNRLSQIVEKDSYGNVIKTFLFDHDYFRFGDCGYDCQRLKLNAIYQVAGNIRQKLFMFQYNESVTLPARNSPAVDYWGYYNSNPYNTKIPPVTDNNEPCPGMSYPGADRSTDTVRVKACILTRVTNVTGQITEYIYSANQYSDDGVNNKFAGGVRIRSINQISDGVIQKSTRYYYNKFGTNVSSGIIEQLPVFHFRSAEYKTSIQGFWMVNDYLIVMSDAIKDLFNINGFHIGYSYVIESESGRGSVRTTFTDAQTNPDQLPTQYSYVSYNNSYAQISPTEFPYAPNISKVFERGLITKQEFLNSEGKLVLEKYFGYNLSVAPLLKSVPGLKIAQRGVDNLFQYYRIGVYKNMSMPYVLTNTKVVTYDQRYPGTVGAADNNKVSVQTDYSYVPVGAVSSYTIPRDMMPRTVMQNFPNGDKVVTQTKYISDYSYTPEPPGSATDVRAFWLMSRDNMITFPVETISYLEKTTGSTTAKYLLSGRITRYKEFPSAGGNKVHVSETRNLKTNGSTPFSTYAWSNSAGLGFTYNSAVYKLAYSALDYDQFGNLISLQKADGVSVTVQYANNGTEVSSVTKNPGQYQQQISYQYRQLVGMIQQTDANGITSKYDYNDMNDLKAIRDADGNIQESYASGFKGQLGQAGTMPLNVTITGSLIAGNEQTFTVNDIAGGKYNFEFSDGYSVMTNGENSCKRGFSAGSYTLKVTSYGHPETGETSAVIQFVILP